MNPEDDRVKMAAMVCLTAIVVASIAGMTVVAVFTSRNLARPEAFTFVVALCVAALGGTAVGGMRRRHRWRVEREAMPAAPPEA